MRNVIVYIDGFNLFHAIDENNDPSVKWINLKTLSQTLIGSDETLLAVKYFTAYATWKTESYRRHERYVKCLEATDVEVILGKFKRKEVRCKSTCGEIFSTHEEKETDVNIGATLVADAIKNRFHRAIVITADTDLKAAIDIAERECPDKTIQVMATPGRRTRARDLNPIYEIKIKRLRPHLFDTECENYIVHNVAINT